MGAEDAAGNYALDDLEGATVIEVLSEDETTGVVISSGKNAKSNVGDSIVKGKVVTEKELRQRAQEMGGGAESLLDEIEAVYLDLMKKRDSLNHDQLLESIETLREEDRQDENNGRLIEVETVKTNLRIERE